MKKSFLSILVILILSISFVCWGTTKYYYDAAGTLGTRGASSTETTAQTRDDVWLSPASIPYANRFKIYEKDACSVTLTAIECSDTLITNYGWNGTADQTFTLPEATAGLKFKFLNLVTATSDIYFDTPGTTTQFILDGAACGDGNRVWSDNATKYESIIFHTFIKDGTNYDWACDSVNGAWLNKGD